MLPVFICEDNPIQLKRLTKYIRDFIMIEDFDMEIALSADNPFEVLEEVKKHTGRGLYFLDIDLQQPKLNGFELAKEIRKVDPRGFIIFITTHSELTYLTFIYKVEALDYIIKDDLTELQKRVLNCLQSVEERMMDDSEDAEKYFTFRVSDKKIIHEKIDDILFFETSPKIHKIILHGKNRQLEFYGKMKEIEKKLGEPFYRCHRSFLVNKNNITEIDRAKGEIIMINGEICLGSTKLIRGIKFDES